MVQTNVMRNLHSMLTDVRVTRRVVVNSDLHQQSKQVNSKFFFLIFVSYSSKVISNYIITLV